MGQISGTNLASPIVPFTTDDSFPTHIDEYGKGGYRAVADLLALANIPETRRSLGMLVYVISEDEMYQYKLNKDSQICEFVLFNMSGQGGYTIVTITLSGGTKPEFIVDAEFDPASLLIFYQGVLLNPATYIYNNRLIKIDSDINFDPNDKVIVMYKSALQNGVEITSNDHSKLDNLEYINSKHTGFANENITYVSNTAPTNKDFVKLWVDTVANPTDTTYIPSVVDNLNSVSTVNALSARQGNVLNTAIAAKMSNALTKDSVWVGDASGVATEEQMINYIDPNLTNPTQIDPVGFAVRLNTGEGIAYLHNIFRSIPIQLHTAAITQIYSPNIGRKILIKDIYVLVLSRNTGGTPPTNINISLSTNSDGSLPFTTLAFPPATSTNNVIAMNVPTTLITLDGGLYFKTEGWNLSTYTLQMSIIVIINALYL